jgi:polyhydroxyalkanoate synthesis regulator phasin
MKKELRVACGVIRFAVMTVEETIKRQMSKISKARTADSRQQGGVTAWETRIENLRAKLARLEARKVKP